MHAFRAVTMSAGSSDEQLDSRAPAVLAEMAYAYWLPRCLHTVAELGVADHIATAPVTAGVLAESCGVNEDALYLKTRAGKHSNPVPQ
jgi:hypothetical protein